MTEQTQGNDKPTITQQELIYQVEDYIKLLDCLYTPGDSYNTHLNVAEQLNYFLEKLEFLKHRN